MIFYILVEYKNEWWYYSWDRLKLKRGGLFCTNIKEKAAEYSSPEHAQPRAIRLQSKGFRVKIVDEQGFDYAIPFTDKGAFI